MTGTKFSVLLISIAIIECISASCPQYDEYCDCFRNYYEAYNETVCRGKGLSEVPTKLKSNTGFLRLISTSITRIPPGLPTSIYHLELTSSNLRMSPDDYVNIPSSVSYLDLSRNEKISTFNMSYLDHVPELRHLKLSYNPLTSLDVSAPSPLDGRLQELYLDGMMWKTLDTTGYELRKDHGYTKLYARNGIIEKVKFNFYAREDVQIMLENNRISTFDATKVNLDGIKKLDLSRNPIQHLDFSSGADELGILHLRNINMKIFDGSKFHLPYLHELDLSDNPIESIYTNGLTLTANFILKNTSLTCIDDRNEGLSNFYKRSKTNAFAETNLDLENNDLKTLSLTQGQIDTLNIKGNKNIARIKFHLLPKDLRADLNSLPCDCCLLKLFEKHWNFDLSKGRVCRNADVYNDNITTLADAIGCDLNRSKTDICESTPPMPSCDGVFKIRPTTPAPPTTAAIEPTTLSSAGEIQLDIRLEIL